MQIDSSGKHRKGWKENKKLKLKFEPSIKTLLRIMKTIIEKGAKGKNQLSLDANLNYTRLANHIVWLERKGLVKSTVEESRITVDLTESGRVFVSTIS